MTPRKLYRGTTTQYFRQNTFYAHPLGQNRRELMPTPRILFHTDAEQVEQFACYASRYLGGAPIIVEIMVTSELKGRLASKLDFGGFTNWTEWYVELPTWASGLKVEPESVVPADCGFWL
jgi:hypothetical protein